MRNVINVALVIGVLWVLKAAYKAGKIDNETENETENEERQNHFDEVINVIS